MYDYKLFGKMPNRHSIINAKETTTLRRSPRFCAHYAPPVQAQVPTTRRSLRFLQKSDVSAPIVPEFRRSKSANRQVHYSDSRLGSSQNVSLKSPEGLLENITKNSSKNGDDSSKNEDLNTGLKKSRALESRFWGIRVLRRSSRLSYVRKTDHELEECNAKNSKNSSSSEGRSNNLKNLSPGVRRSPRLNNGGEAHVVDGDRKRKSHVQNADTIARLHGKTVAQRGRRAGNSSDLEVIAAKDGEAQVIDGVGEKNPVARRKRKRDDDEIGIVQGWTKEQEAALQRAYYAAKPTPQFWKKVSKLVPGKSAQDCFDKVHSDHSTPPQPRPRSRARSMNSSHIDLLSFSEGKLLNLNDANARKRSRNRQKSHVAQKTVRHLLEKNYQGAQNTEADLFSLLEPNIDLSNQSPKPSRAISSPADLQGKQGFLHICHERSSSNHKKPLSRFSKIVSPPVLKQVKNRALHEKYIDQLHSRDAKRKVASRNSKNRVSEKVVIKDVHAARTDNLRAARNALISDARDAINQLRHLRSEAMNDSPDCDDDDYYDNLDCVSEDEA